MEMGRNVMGMGIDRVGMGTYMVGMGGDGDNIIPMRVSSLN